MGCLTSEEEDDREVGRTRIKSKRCQQHDSNKTFLRSQTCKEEK